MSEPLTELEKGPIMVSDQDKDSVKKKINALIDSFAEKRFFGSIKVNFQRGSAGTIEITQHLKI